MGNNCIKGHTKHKEKYSLPPSTISTGMDDQAELEDFLRMNGVHQMNESNGQPNVSQVNRSFTDFRVSTVTFAIPRFYDVVDENCYLGGGSYGNVMKANMKTRTTKEVVVAIKKLARPFASVNNARRVFRELRLLQLMRHDNVIRAVDMYSPDKNFASFRDVYVVTEFAGHSLHDILKAQRESGNTLIQLEHAKFIIYQILRALKYIHSANVMHRDLKPSNLALTPNCDLTVLDFGLARTVEPQNNTMLSQYVMTRWYRSPEVIYWNIGSYDKQADVWSVGCIAAELFIQKPLFPGESQNRQYSMIVELCGCPDEILLDKIEQKNNENMRKVIEKESMGRPRVNFHHHFNSANDTLEWDAIDFLDKVLVLDPERRLTVEQALQHPYLKTYHQPHDEPVAHEPFVINDQDINTIEAWKEIIWNEIQNFNGNDDSPVFA